jgi:uncharacterized YigZ family protein
LKTVTNQSTATYRERGSKFLGFLFPAASVERFDNELINIKSEYPDATHHCFAWRINPNDTREFAQDDGEPSGTAGLPILNQLKSFKAVNCGCVVVRYYGGTNLGKPGLIEAYGYTTRLCFENTSLATLIPTQNYRIQYPYSQQSQIDQLNNRFDLKEIEAEYLEEITIEIACRSEQAKEFAAALDKIQHRGIETEHMGTGFVTV